MKVSVASVGVAAALLSVALIGCTPAIPAKDSFGTSALVSTGNLPAEFAEFNAYDPGVNQLLADQLCATPAMPLETKTIDAAPGRIVRNGARCRTHVPFWGE